MTETDSWEFSKYITIFPTIGRFASFVRNLDLSNQFLTAYQKHTTKSRETFIRLTNLIMLKDTHGMINVQNKLQRPYTDHRQISLTQHVFVFLKNNALCNSRMGYHLLTTQRGLARGDIVLLISSIFGSSRRESLNYAINDSENGLSLIRRHAITWNNFCLLIIQPFWIYFRDIWIEI